MPQLSLLDSAKQVFFLPPVHLLSGNLEKNTWCSHSFVKFAQNLLTPSKVT